jgi:hypothetical protein
MSKSRLAIAALIALLLAAGLVTVGLLVVPRFWPGKTKRMWDSATVIRQVQTLSQLVTVRMLVEKVVVFEDAKWYGDSRVLLVAHGVVKSGVDFSRLKPDDVSVEDGRIRIALPPPVITDAYLDDQRTQVVERTTGLLRKFDKNLEQEARRIAVDDVKRAAHNAGIQKEAEERAHLQVRAMLAQFGYTNVDFVNSAGQIIRPEVYIVKP